MGPIVTFAGSSATSAPSAKRPRLNTQSPAHEPQDTPAPNASPPKPRRAKVKPSAKSRRERSARSTRKSGSGGGQDTRQTKRISPEVLDRLQAVKTGCEEIVPLKGGKRVTVKIYRGSYVVVSGEVPGADYDDMEYPADFWLGQVSEIFYDEKDDDYWLKVRYFWGKYEIEDGLPRQKSKSKRHRAIEGPGIEQMGDRWERVIGPEEYNYVAKGSVLGTIKQSQVILFDDTSLHPPVIPPNAFYIRRMYDPNNGEVVDCRKDCVSLCVADHCSGRRYCPDDEYSQVFCAQPSCLHWMHADCISGKLIDNPYYANKDMHKQGLFRSTPLNPCDPEPEGTAADYEEALSEALSTLDDIPAHGETLSERKILLNLAGKPIVRPTYASISGNIHEVLTARRWITHALENKLEGEELEAL
ncbi:hypothetical protein PENSPDRAFT_758907, partial [Peniophora sp. CONT]